jgi:hypothetical protein
MLSVVICTWNLHSLFEEIQLIVLDNRVMTEVFENGREKVTAG